MRTNKNHQTIIIFLACFCLTACTEKINTPPSNSVKNNCMINLDSGTLELYKIDTQTINIITKSGITNKGSIEIDSNSSLYILYTFNKTGTLITKHTKNYNYPARTFKIEDNLFYYGDDISSIEQCTENSLVIYNETNQISATETKVQWGYLRKK